MQLGGMVERTALVRAWRGQTAVIRGISMMCLSTFAFVAMHTTIRHVSAELHPFQIAFFRNLFGLVFLFPVLLGTGLAQMRTKRLGLHAFRGLINIVAMFLFFTAVSTTPLAKVTALSFTAPIFAASLSVLVLGERFRIHRWAAIIAGFVGMLVILRPGIAVIEPGALMALAAAAIWAVAMILIKMLSRTESSVAIVAWMGIFLCAFSIGPAIMVWRDPSFEALCWLLFIGFTGSIAQVSLSQALKETDPTAVLPFDFLKLIWASLLAAWFFNEVPDQYTWLGAGLIFSAGLYIARRERRSRMSEQNI
ncbi:EamA family transporter [Rhodobacteraceae bacterium NNCM2]|nr:EamA family transporter [Coraliihabitans acroporae]